MKIDVTLSPAEIDHLPQRDLSNTTCVIFDVLRATSSILTALAYGTREIYPASTIEEALALKKQIPDASLGGERHGEKIEGFDRGNSPLEYRDNLPEKIITTTTNGTVALRACGHAHKIIAGALLNIEALTLYLQKDRPQHLQLVCAGTFRDLALEDVFAAGMLCARFPEADLTDSAITVRSLFDSFSNAPLELLKLSKNGKVLLSKGREEELQWCANVSALETVGVMKAGAIRNERA